MKNKRLFLILSSAIIVLLIPFTAMQFTADVNWSPFDFLVAGILLFGTGLIIELILRKVKSSKYRIAICIAVLAIFFIGWAELAVGVFGTPFAGS